MPLRFADLLAQLDAANELDEVRRVMANGMSGLGLSGFTYLLLRLPGAPGFTYALSSRSEDGSDRRENGSRAREEDPEGMTIPVHGPGGEFALISVTPLPDRPFGRTAPRNRYDMQLLAAHCHAAVSRLLEPNERDAVRLSPRERECLLWTARGKTAWEIARILELSQGTVQWHLNNAKAKLGVHGKSHAVVKAMMLGLIPR